MRRPHRLGNIIGPQATTVDVVRVAEKPVRKPAHVERQRLAFDRRLAVGEERVLLVAVGRVGVDDGLREEEEELARRISSGLREMPPGEVVTDYHVDSPAIACSVSLHNAVCSQRL
jgi:hypothetical protein